MTRSLCVVLTLIALGLYQSSVTPTVAHAPGAFHNISGHRIWVESEGTGSPLLLIAGGPMAHNYLHPWFTQLARKFRVIYFEAYGRGESDRAKSSSEYTFDREIEEVENIRQALGLRKISVLGHSYGGLVAIAYAFKYPANVDHLVLVSTLPGGASFRRSGELSDKELEIQFPEAWAQISALRRKRVSGTSKEMDNAYSSVPFEAGYLYAPANAAKMTPSGDMDPNVWAALSGDDGRSGQAYARDYESRLKELSPPTLVIAGRYDRIVVPAETIRFREWLPQGRFVMFEHSGHFPFVEEPEAFNRVVSEFLERR